MTRESGQDLFQKTAIVAQLTCSPCFSHHSSIFRFLPTSRNLRLKEIDQEIRKILRGIIEKREKEIKGGTVNTQDLLGMLLESNLTEENGKHTKLMMTTEEVIGECKLFYFAGQETTSVLLTWTMIVLSMHPNWQVRAREEVMEVFGKSKPDIDGMSRLKIVSTTIAFL